MKTLIKLLIVASMLLSFNTSHAFWGDAGDKYVTVTMFAGDSGTTTFETQLKNIKNAKTVNGKYWVFEKNTDSFNYVIGFIASSKDIEQVKEYLNK